MLIILRNKTTNKVGRKNLVRGREIVVIAIRPVVIVLSGQQTAVVE